VTFSAPVAGFFGNFAQKGIGACEPVGNCFHSGDGFVHHSIITGPAGAQKGTFVSGYLTTHVLDTANGRPAAGLAVALYRIDDGTRHHIRTLHTNADGRTDSPILPETEFAPGTYELIFHAGDWLNATGAPPESPRFLGEVPIRFGMSQHTHYHVPLLLSPFGYSTYRGS
jgi:5-hydroxyisourate hydrolase